ncbi:MAG: carbohydrate kinase [Spirochaetales bacterium]|nr:carbohydrate kinase [Spirochaetales bacterium]
MAGHLLGFDVGSSSVKAGLVEIDSGAIVASASSPDTELTIDAPQAGWAEQHPDLWWEHMRRAVGLLREHHAAAVDSIVALGISYQMHGLVIIDKSGTVLRPSIIWCDSRAVPYGDRAFSEIGEERCLGRLLNSPGNFTAAKLAWVKENEPEIYSRVWKMMLPGDYLAYRMTGELITTPSGLSEGVLWDSEDEAPAGFVLDHFGFDHDILPALAPSFAVHGRVSGSAASELGIPAGVAVSYRSGDQPNNALSLNVLDPGEMAATAGTSGVVYAVVDRPAYDPRSRVNTFVHVNHSPPDRRYGVLLCLNGTGICNRWLKQNTIDGPQGAVGYDQINEMASAVPIGSDGVVVLPFGNGAERTLENNDIGASIHGLNFNVHSRAHVLRAGQEGIVFALAYGVQIMREMGLEVRTVKAGRTNMFQSELFRTAFATTTGATVELYDTDGSAGAARGAGIGAGVYATPAEAFGGMTALQTIDPDLKARDRYNAALERWKTVLDQYGT